MALWSKGKDTVPSLMRVELTLFLYEDDAAL
jgi:ribosomal protein L31E